jgi:ABC-type transporter Mla MlaB component
MPWSVDPGAEPPRLALVGAVEVGEARALQRDLVRLADHVGAIAVDLSACTALDCAALQLLLAFQRVRAARGRPVTLVPGDGPPARLVRRLALDRVLGAPAG